MKSILCSLLMLFGICIIFVIGLSIIWSDALSPLGNKFRYDLANAFEASQREVYVKDFVDFKFYRVYSLHGYGEQFYDKEKCHLKNTAPADEDEEWLSFVKDDCSVFKVWLPADEFSLQGNVQARAWQDYGKAKFMKGAGAGCRENTLCVVLR
jgi:hypothetical protein